MPIKTKSDGNGLKLVYLLFLILNLRCLNLDQASTLNTQAGEDSCVCIDMNLLIYVCKEDPIKQISNFSAIER